MEYSNVDEIKFKPYNSPVFEGFAIPKNRIGRLIWEDNIEQRSGGEFKEIGIYLSPEYDYKIVLDNENQRVLVAIKI